MFGFTKRPLFLIAWKNLKTYPVRIFLTTSSIILGVAVIIASNIFSYRCLELASEHASYILRILEAMECPGDRDRSNSFSEPPEYLPMACGSCGLSREPWCGIVAG